VYIFFKIGKKKKDKSSKLRFVSVVDTKKREKTSLGTAKQSTSLL